MRPGVRESSALLRLRISVPAALALVAAALACGSSTEGASQASIPGPNLNVPCTINPTTGLATCDGGVVDAGPDGGRDGGPDGGRPMVAATEDPTGAHRTADATEVPMEARPTADAMAVPPTEVPMRERMAGSATPPRPGSSSRAPHRTTASGTFPRTPATSSRSTSSSTWRS